MSFAEPKALVVAAPRSGSGKTTVTLALLAALARRGLIVQSYKVGPDFIDPSLHSSITGRPSYSLDGWIYGREGCRQTLMRGLMGQSRPDIIVIEGVMGLFDGAGPDSEEGSTAQMAKWLGAPVLLVVDGKAQGRSVAAQVSGFLGFDPELSFAGVVCNRAGSDRHRDLLCEALRFYCPDIPFWGCLKRSPRLELPSRHLGLYTPEEGVINREMTAELADWLEEGLNLDELLKALPACALKSSTEQASRPVPVVRVAVARDEAFCFHAPENLERLEEAGCELVYFSPLRDSSLPENIDGLILGGGYPELYAKELSANSSMLCAIHEFAKGGGAVWGACGGFMYLMKNIIDLEGRTHVMADVFPFSARMYDKLQSLGYREARGNEEALGAAVCLRGHEFHYSALEPEAFEKNGDMTAGRLHDARGTDRGAAFYRPPGLPYCVGTYMHVHLGSKPGAAEEFVRFCLAAAVGKREKSEP